MEINKQHLEEKLNTFVTQYNQTTQELNKYSVLQRKLEGAIETIQILLKEQETPEIEEKEVNSISRL